jgi:hypothetical protein
MQQGLVKANAGELVGRKLATGRGVPILTRFVGKFILDIMPAALASVIGGFLFTQYHFGHSAPKPVLEQVTPASAEMMALVREEHATIIDYLKAQMAAEKSRAAVEDADLARAQQASRLAEAKALEGKALEGKALEGKALEGKALEDKALEDKAAEEKAAVSAPVVAGLDTKPVEIKSASESAPRRGVASATKPVVWHAKPTAVAAAVPLPQPAPRAPLVIAQADPSQAGSDRPAGDPDSLLGKALDLKDHVVAGARRAVSAIGDMFASVGGALNPSATLPRQLTSSE